MSDSSPPRAPKGVAFPPRFLRPSRARPWLVLAALSAVAMAFTWSTARLDPGLTGSGWRMFLEPEREGGRRPELTSLPGPETVFLAWQSVDEAPIKVAWTGCIQAFDIGTHRFLIREAGTSRLVIDGVLLQARTEPGLGGVAVRQIALKPGPHSVQLTYEPWEGAGHLELWVQRPGGRPRRIEDEGAHLAPRCLSQEQWRWRGVTTRLPIASVVAWMLVAFLALGAGGLAIGRRLVPDASFWKGLGPWIAVTAAVAGWGLWWGLPEIQYPWAVDEIDPLALLKGVEQGFAGPWAQKYPPLHYYLLGATASVIDLATAPVGIDLFRPPGVTLVHVSMRLVSVLMAIGTVIAVGALAHRVLGRAQGRAAMLSLIVSPTWLYYAKVANVDAPYLFWLAWALIAFVCLIERPTISAAAGLGLCAACAIGTKDQAIGFFGLMPLALLIADVSRRRAHAEPAPWLRAVARPAWLVGLGVAAVTLAAIYQWPGNDYLLRQHAALVLLARYPPMAEATVPGYLWLSGLVVRQIAFAMGWPVFALSVVGVLIVCAERQPSALTWLLLPALSYLVFFVGLARYSYDRFLLGVVLILTLFSAHAVARLLSLGTRLQPALRVVLALGLVYSAGYGLSTNQMMVRDARKGAEALLWQRLGPGDVVGFVGWRQYLPPLGRFLPVEVQTSVRSLQEVAPRWLVINERFSQRFVHQDDAARFLAKLKRGELGCAPVFTGPSPLSWWAFAQYTEWLRQPAESGYVILDKVNPPIVVYSCEFQQTTRQ